MTQLLTALAGEFRAKGLQVQTNLYSDEESRDLFCAGIVIKFADRNIFLLPFNTTICVQSVTNAERTITYEPIDIFNPTSIDRIFTVVATCLSLQD